MVDGRALGGLWLGFAQARPFAAAERDFLLALAQQCAQALERARLNEAEQAARQRLALLGQASALLSESLDYETTLTSLARLAVPLLADLCIVDIMEEGMLAHVAVAHVDPAKEELVHELRRRYQPTVAWENHPIINVLRSGRSRLFVEVDDALWVRIARDAEHLRLMRLLNFTSYMIVPLAARGRTLGTITLVMSESGRQYGPADLTLAEVLARRAALAVDNARLYREAQLAETRYSTLFEGVADSIVVFDDSGRPVQVNQAAADLLGYTCEELLNLGLADIVAGNTWGEAEFARLQREGAWHGEVELRRKDGYAVPVEAIVTRVQLASGQAYISVARDISARRESERMQRDFVAMITHDLRSPLTSIKAFAQLTLRQQRYNERALTTIIRQSDRLQRLINDLLDASRLEHGRLELRRSQVDLVSLARAAAEQAQALTSDHTIRLEVAADRPLVGLFDGDRIAQVLENLLGNAIKYSPGGPVHLRVTAGDHTARIAVTDQGPGIAPEALPHLFERFYRAAASSGMPGLGLGLYICKGLVEAHGGAIAVESAVGQGSTFTVTLPLSQSE
jgi:PAS domain S-box-containing protein